MVATQLYRTHDETAISMRMLALINDENRLTVNYVNSTSNINFKIIQNKI